MSFFILPTNSTIINIQPIKNNETTTKHIGEKTISKMKQIMHLTTNNASSLNRNSFNMYNDLFEHIKEKLQLKCNNLPFFASLHEIFESMKIRGLLDNTTSVHVVPHLFITAKEYFSYFDINYESLEQTLNKSFDLLILDSYKDIQHEKEHYLSILQNIRIMLKNTKKNGYCLLRIGEINSKNIVQLLYLISTIFGKIYVMKPKTSDVVSNEKYLFCDNFTLHNREPYESIIGFILDQKTSIYNILGFEVPCIFNNKINDINLMFNEKMLEHINLSVNSMKEIRKHGELTYKMHILKRAETKITSSWCLKYLPAICNN
tara:strand:+ start:5145 stop:6098 length:954 start_codon:yes stop_codon:yes gene_type:complete